VADSVLVHENYFYPTIGNVRFSVIAYILKYIVGPFDGKNTNDSGIN